MTRGLGEFFHEVYGIVKGGALPNLPYSFPMIRPKVM